MKDIFLSFVSVIFLTCNSPAGNSISANDSTGIISNTDTLKTEGQAPAKDTTTLSGQWFLLPGLPSDTAAGRIPRLNFSRSEKKFSGNTGCNSMSGTIEITDTSLVFNERIMLTKMACPGYNEAAFIKSLLRTNRFRLEDGVLVLMFDQTELSRWTRKPVKLPVTNKA